MAEPLLAAGEPAPVTIYNAGGRSPFLLVADHAGNIVPRTLGRLGVADADFQRHIAFDIGIAGLARLVIDCNRPPGAPTSIPEISELTPIPGNVGLSAAQRDAREREIFRPYHDRIEAELDRRQHAGVPTVLIALHSFTPVFNGVARPWHVALLYRRDPRLARCLLDLLKAESGLAVGDNQPYFVSDTTDYTIPVHGERRGLPHALIEVRQDLIADDTGQQEWAARLARLLPQAHKQIAA